MSALVLLPSGPGSLCSSRPFAGPLTAQLHAAVAGKRGVKRHGVVGLGAAPGARDNLAAAQRLKAASQNAIQQAAANSKPGTTGLRVRSARAHSAYIACRLLWMLCEKEPCFACHAQSPSHGKLPAPEDKEEQHVHQQHAQQRQPVDLRYAAPHATARTGSTVTVACDWDLPILLAATSRVPWSSFCPGPLSACPQHHISGSFATSRVTSAPRRPALRLSCQR